MNIFHMILNMITFTYKNIKDEIIKEYNQQKLNEVSQPESFCATKVKQTDLQKDIYRKIGRA